MLARVARTFALFTLSVMAAPSTAAADGGDGGAALDAAAGPCGAVTIKGCCDGEVLRYCAGGALKTQDCKGSPSCGWRADKAFYTCGTTGAVDPTGKHPKACPVQTPDAGVVDRGAPTPDVAAADSSPGDGAPVVDSSADAGGDASTEDAYVWVPLEGGTSDQRQGGGGGTSQGGCACRVNGLEGPPWALGALALLLLLGRRSWRIGG